MIRLPRYRPDRLPARVARLPSELVRQQARAIIDDVRTRGLEAVVEHARRLGDLRDDDVLVIDRSGLQRALARLSSNAIGVLTRSAERVRTFATAHRAAVANIEVPAPGGRAGITHRAVDTAGCYAPGGRFPLPSSVLMTAVTARAAGVESVIVASPRPSSETLAAAAIAGADAVLAVGGAQAIAALAFGLPDLPASDVIVGPGNAWVTAAKQLLAGEVRIDMLAGPSELLVIADDGATPALVAADLLAQAEHDPDALPMLAAHSEAFVLEVERALGAQLADLPTRDIAERALARGAAIVVDDTRAAATVANALAVEHVALHVAAPEACRAHLRHYGALFLGHGSAEVFGDYAAGPNHVLPTGGTARSHGGLSVLDFLRPQMWLAVQPQRAPALIDDVTALARMEGLEGHARAALARR